MPLNRRLTVLGGLALVSAAAVGPASGETPMYGLIGKMGAQPGQRDALATILMEGIDQMPGCLSYVVASDPADPDALWITGVWDSSDSHRASLQLPMVQSAITRAMPIIAGFDNQVETRPLGGFGLGQP